MDPLSMDPSTVLVLCNAIYFKGTWAEKFDPSRTMNDDFHLLDGTTIRVPFMSSCKIQYISNYTDFSVLRLPYGQGRDHKRQFSMYIFLPSSKDGVINLAEKLYSSLEFMNQHLPTEKVAVAKFMVTKFKISFEFEASEVLKELGINLIFGGDQCEGGLSEMVESERHVGRGLSEMVESERHVGNRLAVSGVFHKAFIEVNERGTKAAAVTAILVYGSSGMQPRYENFMADHPFVYLIREDVTGVILFVGHVINPSIAA